MLISASGSIVQALRLTAFVVCFNCIAIAAGVVDRTFNPSLTSFTAGYVNSTIIQPDGKIIIVGLFRTAEGEARTGIARYNVDGSLDLSFNPPDFYNSWGYVGFNHRAELQSTGKILVLGNINGVDGVPSGRAFVRLNQNGSFDAAFFPATGSLLAVLPDDRILVSTASGMSVLSPDGALDPSLQFPSATNVTGPTKVLPNGKLLCECMVNGTSGIYRFNADGSLDNTFSGVTIDALDLDVQADGKVVIVGNFTNYLGFPIRGVLRVNADGTIDTGFNQNGTGTDGPPTAPGASFVSIAPNGKIAIAGSFLSYNGVAIRRLAVLNADGSLDAGFMYPGNNPPGIYDLLYRADGKLIVSANGGGILLNTDGSTDPSYRNRISVHGHGNRVRVLPDGKIIAAGVFAFANNNIHNCVARFNPDGTLDPTFNEEFRPNSDQYVADMDVQADGKILLTGRIFLGDLSERYFVRLNTNGSIDLAFSGSGGTFVKALPDGKFMVGTGRFNANGTPDAGFSLQISGGGLTSVVVQPDGKMIIAGAFTQVHGQTRGRVARINGDGSLDATFNPVGGANGMVHEVLRQTDGKIIIGGEFTGVNFDTTKQYVARLNPDGTLDNSFSASLDRSVLALRLQTDGKILFGQPANFGEVNPRAVGRLNANGAIDPLFNIGPGANGPVNDIDLQPDGNILIVGKFIRVDGESAVSIARLLNASVPQSTLFDYDGDGKSDVSVFRPSENRWYVFRSSDSAVTQQVFAIAGDVPVPADYDGDQKTDIAIYRPSSGAWWYQSSLNGAQISANWGGEAGDIPRPSDFDGDGKTDFVFFRPTNNFWYRITGSGTVSNVQFGSSGDKPVRGDFDGDGKFDVAIFRPSTGDWWYQSSINNAQLAVHWGISTDIPAAADYDGDGRTDFAVYRPSTGVWYIMNSSNGSSTIMAFGLSEDKPVPADYDGDGKADIAVFRPSTGVWYLQRSTSGFSAMQFGVSTDIPTENAFVP